MRTVSCTIDGIFQLHVVHKLLNIHNILYQIPKYLRLRDGSYFCFDYNEMEHRKRFSCLTLLKVNAVIPTSTHYLVFTEFHEQQTLQHALEQMHQDTLFLMSETVCMAMFPTYSVSSLML